MKRIISLFLMLALALSLCACGKTDAGESEQETVSPWQEQYDLGVRYLTEGNYEQAVLAFEAAIEIDPKRVDAYIGLADTYVALGEYDKAVEVWGRAGELAGEDEAERAGFDAQMAHYQEAETFLESGTAGIQILDFSFDRDTYLRGEETAFHLTAVYRCSEGMTCRTSISANVDVETPYYRSRLPGTEKMPLTGTGILRQTVRVIPTQWENGCYFAIGIDIWDLEHGEWLEGDDRYITPVGDLVDHYAPLNPCGAIEFTARRDYREFSRLTAQEQEFVGALASAAMADDTERAKALLGFEWESYEELTMWNGYKVEIYSSGERLTDDGDRSVSASIELRPENGTGYYYRIHFIEAVATLQEDSWSDAVFIERVECPCVDWQWNGTMTYTDSYYHYHTWSDGETCNREEISVTTGTMKLGVRDGVFTTETLRSEVWSKRPDLNENSRSTETREYRAGVLVAENGQSVEAEESLRGLMNERFDEDQYDLERLYW